MLNITPIVMNKADENYFQVQEFLKQQPQKEPCLLLNSCRSTLDFLKKIHDRLPLPNASSVVAQEQKAGRGQCGNSWHSPKGGLYASSLLQKNTFSAAMRPLASLALGVATVEVLRSLGEEVFLKWPNDVVKKSSQGWVKAGGMLLENQHNCFFWGLGLNLQAVHLPSLPVNLEATELSINLSPLSLWIQLWSAVWILLKKWNSLNSKEHFIKKNIDPLLAFKNEKVVFNKDGGYYYGFFRGLNPQGAALIDCSEGEIALYSGSLRPYHSALQLQG